MAFNGALNSKNGVLNLKFSCLNFRKTLVNQDYYQIFNNMMTTGLVTTKSYKNVIIGSKIRENFPDFGLTLLKFSLTLAPRMLNSYAMCVTTFQLGMDSYLRDLQQLQAKKVQNLHFAQFPCQNPVVTCTKVSPIQFFGFCIRNWKKPPFERSHCSHLCMKYTSDYGAMRGA